MKLSEMWHQAAKELKQGKGSYYNQGGDTHCAVGAIVHYFLGHGACNNDMLPYEVLDYGPYQQIKQALHGQELSILLLNDSGNWTFEQFAKKAEELGL